jgi:hypothetical protein
VTSEERGVTECDVDFPCLSLFGDWVEAAECGVVEPDDKPLERNAAVEALEVLALGIRSQAEPLAKQ